MVHHYSPVRPLAPRATLNSNVPERIAEEDDDNPSPGKVALPSFGDDLGSQAWRVPW